MAFECLEELVRFLGWLGGIGGDFEDLDGTVGGAGCEAAAVVV